MAGLALAEGMEAVSMTAECLGAQAAGLDGKMHAVPIADIYPKMGLEPYYPVSVASHHSGIEDGTPSLALVKNSNEPIHPVTEMGAQHNLAPAVDRIAVDMPVVGNGMDRDRGGHGL